MKIIDVTLRESIYYGSGIDYDVGLDYLRNMVNWISNEDIQYVEIGYVNNDTNENLNYNDEYINSCAEICRGTFKLVAMMHPGKADVHRWDVETIKKLSLVRIVCNGKIVPDSIKTYIQILHSMGIKVSVNIAYIMNKNEAEIIDMYNKCIEYGADYIYFADSSGSANFNDIRYYCDLLKRLKKNNKVGIHHHDHLNMAFANAIQSYYEGVDIIDCSITGAGKGGGNLKTEFIVPYLRLIENKKITKKMLVNIIDYIRYFSKITGRASSNYEQMYLDTLVGLFKITLKEQNELEQISNGDKNEYIRLITEKFCE